MYQQLREYSSRCKNFILKKIHFIQTCYLLEKNLIKMHVSDIESRYMQQF